MTVTTALAQRRVGGWVDDGSRPLAR